MLILYNFNKILRLLIIYSSQSSVLRRLNIFLIKHITPIAINLVPMRIIIKLFFILFVFNTNAQMIDNVGNVKYGNEWINYSQEYFKFTINEDGIYRITYQDMVNAGLNASSISGRKFQLFAYGLEIPVYVSTNSSFGSNDYIEFYGESNKSQMDSFLYLNKNDILNPEYSMFTDDASYYLTWNNSQHKRYNNLTNDLSGNLPPVESYYIHEEKIINNSEYIKPLRSEINHIYKSNFDVGEGYGSKLQQINTFTIQTYDRVYTGDKPSFNIRLATNLRGHHIIFKLNNNNIKDIIRNGITVSSNVFNFNYSALSDNMQLRVEGSSPDDKNTISTLSLFYTRKFKFFNKSYFNFSLESSDFTRYYEIKDFDTEGNSLILYDVNNKNRLIPKIDQNTGFVKFILPPSEKRNLILVNSGKSIRSIAAMQKVVFNDITSKIDKNYIIITKRNAFNSGQDLVQEYANYRASSIGGGFKTMIVDINDIYEQFGYGIERHNQSLNNFIIYLKDKFIDPKYILIIGKGLEYNEIRTTEQLNNPVNLFHVPTYGHPGSDNLMAARHGQNYPVLPIGRIAAKNSNQLQTYLNKVKQHENNLNYAQNLEGKNWMKKVIHLVGGTPDIIEQIRSSLNFMGSLLGKSFMGAKIDSYERNSGTSQESVTNLIVDDITSGAAMVTFFGHSGVSGTDFNIAGLDNDKYPVFYSLGCYSGNIHTNSTNGQSENFVLNPGGVIVYAGTSGTGFTGSLARLGKKIYNNTGNIMYGQSVGVIVQKALESIGSESFDLGSVTLNQQFTFHGDPAVKLHLFDSPDYVIDNTSINTIPGEITAGDNSFTLNFNVINIGKGIDDNLTVRIERDLPNGESEVIQKTVEAPKYKKSIAINIPTHGIQGIGENCVSIYINPDNSLNEQPQPQAAYNNNYSNDNGDNSFCFEIINNKVFPLYPEEFGIVNNPNIELQASLSNYFANQEEYIFQIDTSELFNSPLIDESVVSSGKNIIKWSPDIIFQNNTVYYWRIGINNANPDNIDWKNSSFVYLSNSSKGWNQSHYFQYLKDEFDGINFRGRKFDFEPQMRSVTIVGKNWDNQKVCHVDGETWGDMNEMGLGSKILISGWGPQYWMRNKTKTDYNSLEVNRENSIGFLYKPYLDNQVQGIKSLIEAMPDSMTVFFYTILGEDEGLFPERWAKDSIDLGYNLFSLMESYGARKLRLMEQRGTVPYILIFKKGVGVIQEKIGQTISDVFEITQNVTINKKDGYFTSKIIGPAKEWNTVIWQESYKDQNDIESYVEVYKIDKNNNKVLVNTLNSVYNLDISNIDVQQYPYIQLKYYAVDKMRRDPPHLDFWRVLYKEYPDAILKENAGSYFQSDTLDYGDMLKFKTGIFNSSDTDMEPILVRYKIKKQNNEELVYTKRYPPLLANSSYDISFEFDNSIGDLVGYNEFSVEINADQEQIEKTYTNNSGTRSFYVKTSSLPVQVLNFDAKERKTDIYIYWSSINELNCDRYVVEKSLDGINFDDLESIKATGNNSNNTNKYSVIDLNPSLGLNYYRLKQIDFDGKSTYSKVVSIAMENRDEIMISPNPFIDYFIINSYFYNDNNTIELINSEGKVLYSYKTTRGFNRLKINTTDLPKGMFYCKVNNGKNIKTYKVLKL